MKTSAGSQVVALGIDVGSTTVKIVGVDAEGNLAWHWLEQAEPRVEDQVERFLARARHETFEVSETSKVLGAIDKTPVPLIILPVTCDLAWQDVEKRDKPSVTGCHPSVGCV